MIQILIPLAVAAHAVDVLLLAEGCIAGACPIGGIYLPIEIPKVDAGRGQCGKGICGNRLDGVVLQIQDLQVLQLVEEATKKSDT